MAKLIDDKITVDDIRRFCEEESNFYFEIKAADLLEGMGFNVQLAGLYTDPVELKTRQFDIRAVKNFDGKRLLLAVECKNIGLNAPFIVECLPSKKSELDVQKIRWEYGAPHIDIKTEGEVDVPIGKSYSQIGKVKEGETAKAVSQDNVFTKFSQAMNSSYDLYHQCINMRRGDLDPAYDHTVVPILLLPDNTLYQVLYRGDGKLVDGEDQISEVNNMKIFINKEWHFTTFFAGRITVVQKFLHVVTLSGLRSAVEYYY